MLQGTPQYMAPEAIRDSGARTPRSDLYALGAVGYFLLTGTPVFAGKSPLETIHHHLQTEPESLSRRLGRAVPEDLEALILRCLAKDPDQRPDSAKALARRPGGLRGRAALGRGQRAELLARARAAEERGEDGVSRPAAGGPR